MDEELTPLQNLNIAHAIKKLYQTERIVTYDLDLSKWQIKHLYKDTLWVQLLDEPDADVIMRNGIAIAVSQAKAPYRLAKVIMCGDDVRYAKVGEIIRFPQGVGQPYEKRVEGFKTWLLREESVIAVVEFTGTSEEFNEHLVNDIQLAM